MNIMVVGDIIIDEYIHCEISGISKEAPIPVLKVVDWDRRMGGAANVANNICSMGLTPILIGIVRPGLLTFPEELFINSTVSDEHRKTTTKTRIIAMNKQVARYDDEDRGDISREIEDKIISEIRWAADSCNVIVVSDYNKGVVTQRIMHEISEVASTRDITVIVDPKKSDLWFYHGADIITPNREEYEAATEHNLEELLKLGVRLVVTLGEDGISLIEDGACSIYPTKANMVVDVTGAGDTVVAALSTYISLDHDFNIDEAVDFANSAAAIAVSKFGTATVSMEEIAYSDA